MCQNNQTSECPECLLDLAYRMDPAYAIEYRRGECRCGEESPKKESPRKPSIDLGGYLFGTQRVLGLLKLITDTIHFLQTELVFPSLCLLKFWAFKGNFLLPLFPSYSILLIFPVKRYSFFTSPQELQGFLKFLNSLGKLRGLIHKQTFPREQR